MSSETIKSARRMEMANHLSPASDGSLSQAVVVSGNGAIDDGQFTGTSVAEPTFAGNVPERASTPRRAIDVESRWERWSLAGAAVFCWLFLAVALGTEQK